MNMYLKYILAISMVGFVVFTTQAQRLMGLVVEKNSEGIEKALPGANVYWLGNVSTRAVTSFENGTFFIDRSDEFNQLIISFVGYRTDTVLITDQKSIKVLLSAEKLLNEVTIQGWRASSGLDQLKTINTVVMTEKELFKAACCN
ncbi:MAG: carboxypeptidase-like regulatory domain-containing protein, partial [Burkholderiales bacterium]